MEQKHISRKGRSVYASFSLIFLTAAIILNIVYLLYSSYQVRKADEAERYKRLDQIVFYMDRYMNEIENWANTLSMAEQVQSLMTYHISKNYMDYREGMNLLAKHAMTIPGVYCIDLYVHDTKALVTSYEGVYYDLTEEESAGYEKYLERTENCFWDLQYQGTEPRRVCQIRNDHYISLVKPVVFFYSGKKSGVLVISVRVSDLADLFSMENSDTEGICLNYQGEPILGEVPDGFCGKRISGVSEHSGMEIIYYYTSSPTNVISIRILLVLLTVVLFFMVMFFGIVKISERKMFAPAEQLLNGFRSVEEGHFDLRLDDRRSDLFRELFQGFNHMAGTLEQTLSELSTERIRRNEFKFRLLQMQIKPHFLYNLFNNMVWMAEQKDYERLELLIQSTAGYYKSALNSGNRDIMLLENQKQLEYYVEIQKIRHGDIFVFQVDFPEEVIYYSIPNLLLQPLVENSILHGRREETDRKLHILVRAAVQNGMLELTVSDDGRGIEAETLQDILREIENYDEEGSRYFALVNVAGRLHNRYKDQADLRIESKEGQGTRVTIRISLREVK